MTAEEVAEVFRKATVENAGASPEVRSRAVHQALAEFGYTPVDAIRARLWLRRGKPDGYRWHV